MARKRSTKIKIKGSSVDYGREVRNVSPETDPVGCAGQAVRNVSPETDPIGCAGQSVRNMSPLFKRLTLSWPPCGLRYVSFHGVHG